MSAEQGERGWAFRAGKPRSIEDEGDVTAVQGDVEATKRSLEDPRTKAELLAALERVERELREAKSELDDATDHIKGLWREYKAAEDRAEKAERALAEIDKFHPDEESMAGSIARAALRSSEKASE